MSRPRFSVVIPTLNGGSTLPALLECLWSQRTSGSVEIIAVDSGSSDNTIELLASKHVRIVEIDRTSFDHGSARNAGIEKAQGELAVLIVQDAAPVGDHWLESLAQPFANNPQLAGAFSRQRPRPDASALTCHYLESWVATSVTPWTTVIPGGAAELDAMSPMERLATCTFDNVASCIRRDVWERFPFRPTPIAEDLEWAKTVLMNGYSLAFVPEAVVVHSHDRSALYEYRRTRLLHARLADLFGVETIPTASALARAMLSTATLHARLEWRNPARWARALALAIAWPAGQFAGARDARRGRGRPVAQPGRV